MRKIDILCVVTFPFIFNNITYAKNIDLTDIVGPDPWLTHYNRFSTEHRECLPVSGNILINPQYARMQSFYDNTHVDPMILTPEDLEGHSGFRLGNKACRINIAVERFLDWDAGKNAAPSIVSDNENNPRTETPVEFLQIHYDDKNENCTQIAIPFMINSTLVLFSQSSSFLSGYKMLVREGHDKQHRILYVQKPGCRVEFDISFELNKDKQWRGQSFR